MDKSVSRYLEYFVNSEENPSAVLQQFLDLNEYEAIILYLNRQVSLQYTLWDVNMYDDEGNLEGKKKVAFDEKNRPIMSYHIDLNTGEIANIPSPYKRFYINEFDSDRENLRVQCEYNTDGTLQRIFDEDPNYGYIHPFSVPEFFENTAFSEVRFRWSEHPYYHSLYPLLPVGEL